MDTPRKAASKPFLKWPGGKRWLCPTLLEITSSFTFNRYFEPFLGGGALFFALRPDRSVLSDVNQELINVYRQVRRVPHHLIAQLQKIPVSKESYDLLRNDRTTGKLENAIRFLFLNRTAFAGMYRLNQKGEFNVPFGGGERRPDVLWESGLMVDASLALRSAELLCADFEFALLKAREGDLVYCDPTYTVAHNNNGFIRYNESNFRWSDQERLATLCNKLRSRGVITVVSNAFHREIRSLYPSASTYEVDRPSLLCPAPDKRRRTREYLFVLRP
jgi:DNA adenine methylase